MSKTKQAVTDKRNQPKTALAPLIQQSVTDKAAVVEGFMFHGTETPPVVYVQSDERVVVVAPTADAIADLCEAVTKTLADNGYTFTASHIYGDEVATCKVWQVIDVKPIK